MELFDVVLGDGDFRLGGEDRFHHIRVTGHLLLVAVAERLDLKIGEQPLDLTIGEPTALDAARGVDALDGGHPTEFAVTMATAPRRADRPGVGW